MLKNPKSYPLVRIGMKGNFHISANCSNRGGNVRINGNLFEITIQESIVTSRGEKDGGIIPIPPA
jgi:hypothetical protein